MRLVFWNLFLQIISGILGIWLANRFVTGVDFIGPLFLLPKKLADLNGFSRTLVFVGIVLGLLNSIVRPLLNKIAFPLRIITLNLFSLLIAMFLIWLVDVFSPELIIKGIKPLFWTTVIVFLVNFFLSKWLPAKRPSKNR